MASYPRDLQYTKSHEWVRKEANGVCVVGITDYAQTALGDLVFVELPVKNKQVNVGDEVAVVESVKTAADVYSPVNGTIIAVNEQLQQHPAKINQDPYGEGWLFRITLGDVNALKQLLNAEQYEATLHDE